MRCRSDRRRGTDSSRHIGRTRIRTASTLTVPTVLKVPTALMVLLATLLLVVAMPASPAMVAKAATASDASTVTIGYGDTYDDGEVEVRWGSSLFSKDAFTYDGDLASVSAALCAASSDGGITHLGEGRYIVPALEALGFSPERISLFSYPGNELNETSASGADDWTFAFAIASRNMGDFDLVVVVLRGTSSVAEVLGDGLTGDITSQQDGTAESDFIGYQAYGFYLDFEEAARTGLDGYLQEHAAELEDGDVRFLVTGHSLGGAAANLLAADLDELEPLGATAEHIYAYTFGGLNSITVNNTQADLAAHGNIWNIFNAYDTFGPLGEGTDLVGFKPTDGDKTIYHRFGNVVPFAKDYREVFSKGYDRYANHSIASYVDAVSSGVVDPHGADVLQLRMLLS